MTSSGSDAGGADVEHERRRRLRAAGLLGDLLPGTTSDETDEGWGEGGATSRRADPRDEELLRDVPPHHG